MWLQISTNGQSSIIFLSTLRDYTKYKENIENMLRLGAIFYNDCLYISHNLALITHTYRNDVSEYTLGFIDMIPRLRLISDEIMSKHMNKQLVIINEYILLMNINTQDSHSTSTSSKNKNILMNTNSNTNANENQYNNEEAVNLLINHFELLRSQWSDVLQENVYERLIGYLIENLLNNIIGLLFIVECITESAATDISRLLRSIRMIRLV